MTALLLLAQLTTGLVCNTPQPAPIAGQPWVCVNGGWLPPGHPQAPAPEPGPGDPGGIPVPPPNPNGFRIGHTYRRTATGTRLYIMSLGQDVNGFFAYTGQCLDERTEDHCYAKGWPRLIYAHMSTSGWEDLGPYPDGFKP